MWVRPKRAKGRSLEEIIEGCPELKELGVLTDGTERPIRRPKDEEKQKTAYSGKKKRHTNKHVTITHPKCMDYEHRHPVKVRTS
jgi:hypothetical protein